MAGRAPGKRDSGRPKLPTVSRTGAPQTQGGRQSGSRFPGPKGPTPNTASPLSSSPRSPAIGERPQAGACAVPGPPDVWQGPTFSWSLGSPPAPSARRRRQSREPEPPGRPRGQPQASLVPPSTVGSRVLTGRGTSPGRLGFRCLPPKRHALLPDSCTVHHRRRLGHSAWLAATSCPVAGGTGRLLERRGRPGGLCRTGLLPPGLQT